MTYLILVTLLALWFTVDGMARLTRLFRYLRTRNQSLIVALTHPANQELPAHVMRNQIFDLTMSGYKLHTKMEQVK